MTSRSWLARTLLLAVGYYAVGRLTQLLTTHPSDAVTIWPAVGVALAGTLALGFRAWPGILLASFCLDFPKLHDTMQAIQPAGLLAAALGMVACLQASVGAWLVRRTVGYPVSFSNDIQIAKFLAVGGPVAGIAGATAGIAILWLAADMPRDELVSRWLALWVGNSIGALVFMPVWLGWTAAPQQPRWSEELLIGTMAGIPLVAWIVVQLYPHDWRWSLAVAILSVVSFLLMVRGRALASPALHEHWQRNNDIRDNVFDAYVVIDADSRIREWNAKAESLFGWSRAEVLGLPLTDTIIPAKYRQGHLAGMRRYLATGENQLQQRIIEATAMHRDGHEFPIELKVWIRHGEDGEPEFHALLQDIGARLMANRRLMAQTAAAAALIESNDLVEVAPKLLQSICNALDWAVGALWTVDTASQTMRCAGLWRGDDGRYAAFASASYDATFAPGIGLPGHIWITREPIWVSDVTHRENFPRTPSAIEDGLRSAFGLPVCIGGEVVAVLEFFSSAIQRPDPALLGMMETLGSLLGQFIARTKAERALEQKSEFLSALLDNINAGIAACDEHGMLTLFNKTTRELHGRHEERLPPERWAEHYGLYLADGITPMAPAEVPLHRAFNGEQIRDLELVVAPPGRDRRLVACSGRALVNRAGEKLGAVVVMHDITDRREAELRLQQLAHFDPLTGLPNRRLFQDSLRSATAQVDAQGGLMVVLFLDLDKFKDINDTLGHAVGDELLRHVGSRLRGYLRVHDTVARLGGDEFGVILITPNDPQIVAKLAHKIQRAFAAPFELTGHTVSTTASIGITVYPSDTADASDIVEAATDIHSLVRYADLAMHEAKQGGRNAYRFYTEAMTRRARDKVELESALRDAFKRRELVLHYQPKVCLRSGRWTGVEALLRWQRPGYGLVPPDQFIPVLEDTGLIVAVGAWVIGAACRQLRDWQNQGIVSVPVAVNVSAQQFKHMRLSPHWSTDTHNDIGDEPLDLWSTTVASLEASSVAPSQLELELTESRFMIDAEHNVEMLRRLKALGVRISLDDFGTGYSSLAYLRRFPLDAVKIDGAFIRDVTENADDASITLAIISMAHRLNLPVVAECVETKEQVEFLRANGCDQAQGYYLARPMPADALERLWRETGGFAPGL